MEVKGRCLMTGLPRAFTAQFVRDARGASRRSPSAIVEAIHSVLERTPPELVGDISTNGIVMTGGGSPDLGLRQAGRLQDRHRRPMWRTRPVSCVAYGTGNCLENLASMQDGTINLSRKRQMR